MFPTPITRCITLQVLAFLVALLSACSSVPPKPVPEADFSAALPDASARYLSTLINLNEHATHNEHAENEALQSQWIFWRTPAQLVRENLDTHVSDIWELDGKSLIQKKMFHDDKRGVEFQHDDLRMLNIEPGWNKLALLFDPELLQQLKLVDSGWRDNVPYRRYTGRINAADWIIELRTDLMLPLLIERKTASQHETIKLVQAYTLAASPWQKNTGADYNIIDFADLGDMENDPFVKKVEAMLGSVHHH